MILFQEILYEVRKDQRIEEFMVMNHPALGNPANQGMTTSDPMRFNKMRDGISGGRSSSTDSHLSSYDDHDPVEELEDDLDEETDPPFKKRTWEK